MLWTQIRTRWARLSNPGFGALGHQPQYNSSVCYPSATRPLCLILGPSTCAISFKHGLYLGCTTCALQNGWHFSLYSAPPSRKTINTTQRSQLKHTSAQDAMQMLEGRSEEMQRPFVCFTFCLLLYIAQTDSSIFWVLPTTACSLWRNCGFSAQFCASAVSLPVGANTLFSASTTALSILLFLLHSVSSFYVLLPICLFLWTPTGVYSSLQACRKDKHSFSPTVSLWSSHNISH